MDGRAHYRLLQLDVNAGMEDVRRAYREAARLHHPDKGGDAAVFARVQTAFQASRRAGAGQVMQLTSPALPGGDRCCPTPGRGASTT